MKKSFKLTGATFALGTLVLAGCNETQDNTVESQPAESSPVENSEQVTPNDYGFTSFDLNIDTPDENDVIDIDYETGRSGTEIEYRNKMEDFNLGGDEAGTELDPIFAQFELTPSTTKEEAIALITEAFGVSDYKEFELEVEFEDGTEVNWEDRK
ncbi:YusW family protein [Chryseomicrobium sp. FSL W7-1435]|uniref:YusW family protein n=1 Tax=Chryseomicrobium sp. FSL W7-1435 TaxID=2921704 RepID=UPI00315B1450